MSRDRIRRLLSDVSRKHPYHDLAESGLSPGEIKSTIIEILDPYFEHREVLEENAVKFLGNEAINVIRLQSNPLSHKALKSVLALYRRAHSIDSQRCFQIIGEWHPEVIRGLSEYWSFYHLELDKNTLEIEEFMSETARNIGGMIEAVIQPRVRELLAQLKLIAGEDSSAPLIRRQDFGWCVDRIRDKGCLPEICDPLPWSIPLSQWRNMAHHHSFDIRQGKIVGTYGREPNIKTVTLTRQEMIDVAICISDIYTAANAARAIFVLDNLENASPFLPITELRAEIRVMHLTTALATQGFVLEDIRLDEEKAHAVVRDATSRPPKIRSIHSSQFMYMIWLDFPRKSVVVEYLTRDRSGQVLFEVSGEVCRGIQEGSLPFTAMAELMEIRPKARES